MSALEASLAADESPTRVEGDIAGTGVGRGGLSIRASTSRGGRSSAKVGGKSTSRSKAGSKIKASTSRGGRAKVGGKSTSRSKAGSKSSSRGKR